MTTADEAPEEPKTEDTPSSDKKRKKKPKSAGFIESTSFKPTWLETGPLSPDMLPPEPAAESLPVAEAGDELPDEFAIQMAELERLYRESAEDPAEASDELEEAVVVIETSNDDGVEANGVAVEEVPDSPPETDAESEVVVTVADEEMSLSAVEADDLPADLSESEIEDEVVVPLESEHAEPVELAEPTDAAEVDRPVDGMPDTPVAEVAPVAPPATVKRAKTQKQRKPARKHPLFDRLARTLLIIGLVLLGLAALTYFVNPFARLALSTAELARPMESPVVADPAASDTGWCVTGTFLEDGQAPPRMQDNGSEGDIVAGDQVFALELDTIAPGTYQWQVVDCEETELSYPTAPAWLQVDTTGQAVTFLFNSEERDDPLFFPVPFAVSAFDATESYQVVGSFQEWNAEDPSANMQHLGGGVYQQVRRIARPGNYEAYIIAGSPDQAIDAFGRTSEPIPFSFETGRPSDTVVFLLDTNRGRASVLYGMPWVATQLAYGTGFRVLSLVLGLGGLLLLAWLLLRLLMMGNDKNWLDAGCPQCGHHELMRVSRHSKDRLLNTLGIPAYHYQCRNCTWTGTRLSEDGAAISPGATTIRSETTR